MGTRTYEKLQFYEHLPNCSRMEAPSRVLNQDNCVTEETRLVMKEKLFPNCGESLVKDMEGKVIFKVRSKNVC